MIKTKKVLAKDGTVLKGKNLDKETLATGLYEGTLRVVTEADMLADPRLVGASVVVGQLYDFSNLPFVKDGATEAYVEKVNEKKNDVEEAKLNPAVPEFTSESERAKLNADFPKNTVVGETIIVK